MAEITRVFPDVVKLIATALEELAGGTDHTGNSTPDDLAAALPFIRVTRGGGGDDWLNDHPTVVVDVFNTGWTNTWRLAENVRQWLGSRPPPIPQLDRVRCENGPEELPWNDQPNLRRFGMTFTVTTRRVPASA